MDQQNIYNATASVNSDSCWRNAKDNNNNNIEKYSLYNNNNYRADKHTGTLPAVAYDHVNLHGRPGYGVSDDYLIDIYSSLRSDPSSSTRDRCPVQLITRTFTGGPQLKAKERDIDKELDYLSGSDTRTMKVESIGSEDINVRKPYCKKLIMEETTNKFMPMLDCIQDIQHHDHIVPVWTRGGEDTRSYVNKVKFSRCNNNNSL